MRRSAGAGACTGAGTACTDSAGAHGTPGRRGADRAAGILRRRSASIRLVLITNHIATHVPALVRSRASRSRACSGSLCICYPGDCHERSASNRSEIDFVHGVSSLVDRQECRQISMRTVKPRSVKFSNRTSGRGNSEQNNPRHLQVRQAPIVWLCRYQPTALTNPQRPQPSSAPFGNTPWGRGLRRELRKKWPRLRGHSLLVVPVMVTPLKN